MCPNSLLLETAYDFQSANDAQWSIEPTTSRHRVEMRPHSNRRQVIILSAKRGELGSGTIHTVRLGTETVHLLSEPVSGLFVVRRPTQATDSPSVSRGTRRRPFCCVVNIIPGSSVSY